MPAKVVTATGASYAGVTMNDAPQETLTLARFSSLLQTHFLVRTAAASEPVQIELVQVTPGGAVTKAGAQVQQFESFSLLFHGPQSQPLPQGTHSFEHPQLGTFELFIVPVAAESGRLHYQAVFNRLVQASSRLPAG